MKRIKDIIAKNPGISFVVMTKNKEEFETLRDILIELNYEPSIPLDSLENMMNSAAEDTNYNCGWRISEDRGIAWNESLEHWREYYADILAINDNGELTFV